MFGTIKNNFKKVVVIKWSGRQDLNLQPHGPKPRALPSCATSRIYIKIIKPKNGALEGIRTPDLLVRSQTLYPAELRARNYYLKMVAPGRIELPTPGFSVLCSTN